MMAFDIATMVAGKHRLCVLTAALVVVPLFGPSGATPGALPRLAAQAPLPRWVRSVEVVEEGTVVRREPIAGSDRLGTLRRGTRLALGRRVAGRGCDDAYWTQIAGSGYVCELYLRPSSLPPGAPLSAAGLAAPGATVRGQPPLLPHAYAFVAVDGARAFAHPADYDADQYAEAYGEGFGLIIDGVRTVGGITFARTRRGLWIERSALRFPEPSRFQGVLLDDDQALDVAWSRRSGAPVFERPGGRVLRQLVQRAVVRLETDDGGPLRQRGCFVLRDGGFMRIRDLVVPTATPRPSAVAADERWIDVDVSTQTLTAYRGDRPVFTTLVSTGRDLATHRTPLGEFRIWVKLATSDMDDLERDDVERNYAIEGVPWVQYFEGANGLHAAFWHDDFGRRRSHGCVNLSPRDARRLFDFTQPPLPAGWQAILPTVDHASTLIRVRDGRPVPAPAPAPAPATATDPP